jgi:hypothetical protein
LNNADLQITINQEIKKHELRKLQTMGWELCIPPADFQMIEMMIPALASKDAQERNEAWRDFINSELSEPYRVRRFRSKMRMN